MNEFSRKLPVWYQLATLLRTEILNGDRPGGAQLEPELQLAAKYGLSVMPVRQALKSLEAEGLVTRQRGRGTFVSPGRKIGGYTSLASLYSTEFETPAQLIERGRIAPPAPFREAFAAMDELCFVRRLAFRDGAPWSYGTLYYLTEFDERVTAALLRRYPLYRVLEEQYGVQIHRSRFTARALAATPEVARHLRIEPFAPAMNLTAISYDAAGRTIGAFDMSFTSDQHAFSFEVLHSDAS
jgi:GntR family transcriptional regulator